MATVIARDATAADHLVYAWPFPLGPEEIEVACGEDEIVVMCPSWLVGDRLGPGRHRWRTPDPTRPVGVYFVSMSPVESSFDVTTSFVIPATQQTATLRAQGSVIVRCVDPGLLIAQFVGLPFDNVNDGLLRSVTRSSERLIARVLTRRTVMAQTAVAVTDPGMTASIIDELIAYNPVAGAVFGVEFVRMTGLYVTTGAAGGDAAWQTGQLEASPPEWGSAAAGGSVEAQGSAPRYLPKPAVKPDPMTLGVVSGEIGRPRTPVTPDTTPVVPAAAKEDTTAPGIPPVSTVGLVPPPPEPTPPAVPVPAPAPATGTPTISKATAKGVPVAPIAPVAAAKDGAPPMLNPDAKITTPIPRERDPRSTMRGHAVPTPEKRAGSNPGIDVGASSRPGVAVPALRAHAATEPPPLGGIAGEPPPASSPAIVIGPPGPTASAVGTPPPPAPTPLPPITPPVSASAALKRTKTPSTPVPPVPAGLTPSLAAILPRPKGTSSPPPVGAPAAKPDGAGDGVVARPRAVTPSDGVPVPVMGIGLGMGGGIGVGRVGESASPIAPGPITSEDDKAVKGEIIEKLDRGSRVLVPGPDGRLVSATIRQEQSGYYELEIGGSGETLWVPRANVVAET
jgi:hypothetical protein